VNSKTSQRPSFLNVLRWVLVVNPKNICPLKLFSNAFSADELIAAELHAQKLRARLYGYSTCNDGATPQKVSWHAPSILSSAFECFLPRPECLLVILENSRGLNSNRSLIGQTVNRGLDYWLADSPHLLLFRLDRFRKVSLFCLQMLEAGLQNFVFCNQRIAPFSRLPNMGAFRNIDAARRSASAVASTTPAVRLRGHMAFVDR
jgi:hypothetical protein